MTRREMLIAAAGSLVAPTSLAAGLTRDLPPRTFRRFDYAADKWSEPIDPSTIKAGDVIWVVDPPPHPKENRVILVSRNEPSEGCLYSEWEIDPKTNTWTTSYAD